VDFLCVCVFCGHVLFCERFSRGSFVFLLCFGAWGVLWILLCVCAFVDQFRVFLRFQWFQCFSGFNGFNILCVFLLCFGVWGVLCILCLFVVDQFRGFCGFDFLCLCCVLVCVMFCGFGYVFVFCLHMFRVFSRGFQFLVFLLRFVMFCEFVL